jgi:ABC-2 type transport system permease protein
VILTVVRIGWKGLVRDPLALVLTFVMPIVFFSIFAAVFGSMDAGHAQSFDVAVVAHEGTELGRRFVELLDADRSVRVLGADTIPTEEDGRERIRDGRIEAAVVLEPGFGAVFEDPAAGPARVRLLADSANPIAVQALKGILQAAALQLAIERLTDGAAPAAASEDLVEVGVLSVDVEDVLGEDGKRPSIAFFAAGIGVMFLLFSLSGRAGILLEERETGVVQRLMTTRLGLGRLLVGRWLFLAALGFVQVATMFVWGALVFGLDLWTPRHLAGFVVLTAFTAGAAAGLGLLLSTLCRSRAQLTAVSIVVVLVMSALGGSMFPRFLMPEELRTLGRLTFNAWALDGYQKIFWYERPLASLAPQLAVLGSLVVLFLLASRLLLVRRV